MRIPFVRHHTNSTRFISLDTTLCRACWACVEGCPQHAIGSVDLPIHRHAVITEAAACTGCLTCVRLCGHGAFTPITDQRTDTSRDAPAMRKPFNSRGFIAVALFIAGAILPVSGIMNHQLQMEPMTTARHFWMAVHNMAATLFTLASLAHVGLNWKALVRHTRAAARVVVSREAGLAVLVVLGMVGLFAGHALHAR